MDNMPMIRKRTIDEWLALEAENRELAGRLTQAERERDEAREQRNNFFKDLLYPDEPCQACSGLGRRGYPSTSTWSGGIGGATVTSDICDKCWGSGTTERPGTEGLGGIGTEVARRGAAALRRVEGKLRQAQAENRELAAQVAAAWLEGLEAGALVSDCHWPEAGHIHPEEAISCQMSISVMIRRLKAIAHPDLPAAAKALLDRLATLEVNLEQAKHDRNTYNRMYQGLKLDMAELRGERDAFQDALSVTKDRLEQAEAREKRLAEGLKLCVRLMGRISMGDKVSIGEVDAHLDEISSAG